MKKNYLYLVLLIFVTVILTLVFASLYKGKVSGTSYSYENLNKITALEFDEYMIENPDTIIYLADKTNLDYNKFDKKFIAKLKSLNLLENVIYIEKEEITVSLQTKISERYLYKYNENDLPAIIVVDDGKVIQISRINDYSSADTIIDYEVFKW